MSRTFSFAIYYCYFYFLNLYANYFSSFFLFLLAFCCYISWASLNFQIDLFFQGIFGNLPEFYQISYKNYHVVNRKVKIINHLIFQYKIYFQHIKIMQQKRKILLLIITAVLICSVNSWQFNNPFAVPTTNQAQQVLLFDQIIDHSQYLTPAVQSTWKQRYFVYNQYFDPKIGPVILYICGEAECRGISDTSYTAQIAKQTKGLVLSLEHRYYGKSLPFGNMSFTTNNLKYLTAEQALNDLAYFISQVTQKSLHNVGKHNKWITVGGSYPGALSAWFRSKFPHLTVGAIASSAVVLAVENFRAFDQQIYTSTQKSGNFCTQAILKVNQYVEDQVLSDNRFAFQSQFKAEKLTSREFLFYWSDVIVFFIQYGKRVSFCNSLQNKTLQETFNIIKESALNVPPYDYGAYYLKDPVFAYQDGRGARSWIYQSCTEFSYFQTFSNQHPMRSKMLTIDFYRAWCEDIFGNGTWPYVKRVNNQFGGLSIVADNLIMTNGDEDPWRWASLQKSQKNIISKIIECDDCAHCSDLHAPTANDPKQLKSIREEELILVKKWIAQG